MVQLDRQGPAANTGWRRGIGPSGLEGKHDRGVLGTVLKVAKIRQEQTPVMHTHTHTGNKSCQNIKRKTVFGKVGVCAALLKPASQNPFHFIGHTRHTLIQTAARAL